MIRGNVKWCLLNYIGKSKVAPLSMRISTTFTCPLLQAMDRVDWPEGEGYFNNSNTDSIFPSRAAIHKGVAPVTVLWLAFAPLFNNNSTISLFPSCEAANSAVPSFVH